MRVLIRWLRWWGMVAAACLCAVLALVLLAFPPAVGWMHPRVSRETLLATCRGDCEMRYVRRGDVLRGFTTARDPNAGAWVIASGGYSGGVAVVLDDPALIGTAIAGTHLDLVGGPQPYLSASYWMSMYSARDRAFPAWWPGWLSGEWRVSVGIVAAGIAVSLAIVDVGRRRYVRVRRVIEP